MIGKNYVNEQTEFSGAHIDPMWDGNIILFVLRSQSHLGSEKCKYMYLGHKI